MKSPTNVWKRGHEPGRRVKCNRFATYLSNIVHKFHDFDPVRHILKLVYWVSLIVDEGVEIMSETETLSKRWIRIYLVILEE